MDAPTKTRPASPWPEPTPEPFHRDKAQSQLYQAGLNDAKAGAARASMQGRSTQQALAYEAGYRDGMPG